VALLSSSDYGAIRAAIDIALDSTTLPDAIIALDLYVGAGQRDVLSLDPLAESRSGTDVQHAKTAAILFTAARIVGALPQIVREKELEYEYQRAAVDAIKRAAELRALAEAEIDAYLDPSQADTGRPTVFAVASGRRGRW
jgi:hypothetical protein